MDTKQSPSNLGLSFGVINCLVVFPTHFNPNNFLLIILQILLLFTCTPALRAIFQVRTSSQGIYFWRGDVTEGFFLALPLWGAYILRGFIMKRLIFGILRSILKFSSKSCEDYKSSVQENFVAPGKNTYINFISN